MASETHTLATERLLLRSWRPADRAALAALNADPRVMEWFPATLSPQESDAVAEVIERRLRHQGWGFWAVEIRGGAEFIGFVGLNPAEETLGYPAVEIGWRLAAEHWGHGYAPEAARASLRFGFDTLGLDQIVALTAVGNVKSRRVMEKIGMTHDPADDFENQRIPEGSPLRRHVLYRITPELLEAGAQP